MWSGPRGAATGAEGAEDAAQPRSRSNVPRDGRRSPTTEPRSRRDRRRTPGRHVASHRTWAFPGSTRVRRTSQAIEATARAWTRSHVIAASVRQRNGRDGMWMAQMRSRSITATCDPCDPTCNPHDGRRDMLAMRRRSPRPSASATTAPLWRSFRSEGIGGTPPFVLDGLDGMRFGPSIARTTTSRTAPLDLCGDGVRSDRLWSAVVHVEWTWSAVEGAPRGRRRSATSQRHGRAAATGSLFD